MPILVDGNNLLHALPRSKRTREAVRHHTLELTRFESIRVIVVFDGPAPDGAGLRESLGNVTIAYSGGRSADDVIVGWIPSGGPAADWVVVTDDGGLARRARELGAKVRTIAEWRGRRGKRPAPRRQSTNEAKLSARELAEWERLFSKPRSGDDEPQGSE